jgi:hypothetical protein
MEFNPSNNVVKLCVQGIGLEEKDKPELAISFRDKQSDTGPFYHGTKADLQIGDLLTAGSRSNYNPEA